MKKKSLLTPAATSAVPDLATKAHDGTPQYGDYGHPPAKPTPEPAPDLRAEGGNVVDLRNEQISL